MLHDLNKIQGYDIAAEDGSIGSVHDVFFDDRYWTVRYLIVDTGNWLPGRKVLIDPSALTAIDHDNERLALALTRQQIEDGPDVGSDLPVSRQRETQIYDYFRWPYYWAPFSAGLGAAAVPLPVVEAEEPPPEGDPNLRSVREVSGYEICADDDNVGHVETFLADDANWRVPYFVVDTRDWLPGRHVLIGTSWVDTIDWNERRVVVNLDRQRIETSPEYDASAPLDRDYEERLHRHYERPGYWDS